ncbi:hypothetical protein [Cellulosimicrobium cellulans]|uniref:hypothetical protein n=1 Tax=Cellulosimicrobium cellulans TaxID=1710 RepID=UPI00130D5370|nr:hypothetical protein [Cellulosimicrobium cellulans]
MPGWERALEAYLAIADEDVPWMLVGSAATRVQGVAVEPGDVDVLVHPGTTDDAVRALAERLTAFAVPGPGTADLATFRSTPDRPLAATPDRQWLFGRWCVDGGTLEIARIRADVPAPAVVETMGTGVWATRRTIGWRGQEVPVVPLEVQLATVLLRGQRDRERAVRARLAAVGTDEALLARALADRGLPAA